MKLGVHAAFRAPNQGPEPLFYPRAGSRPVGLEIRRVDHDDLALCSLRHSQVFHHLEKGALVTPMFPAVITRLGGAIFLWRLAPPEVVAFDENDAAQNASIINALATMALGEIRLKRVICSSVSRSK